MQTRWRPCAPIFLLSISIFKSRNSFFSCNTKADRHIGGEGLNDTSFSRTLNWACLSVSFTDGCITYSKINKINYRKYKIADENCIPIYTK